MKKYGMADVMITAIKAYLAQHKLNITDEQRREIERRCCEEILLNYPTARELEVSR